MDRQSINKKIPDEEFINNLSDEDYVTVRNLLNKLNKTMKSKAMKQFIFKWIG